MRSRKEVPEMFDFSFALQRMREGGVMARGGWNGKGMRVHCASVQSGRRGCLAVLDDDALMRAKEVMNLTTMEPFLVLRLADGSVVPWLPSQSDLFAYDWFELHRGE